MTRFTASSSLLLLAVVLGACSSGGDGHHEVVVSAAASLSSAFTEIAESFEAVHPDASIALNFGGSSALRTQILEGAPVDVFASADLANMEQLIAAGRVEVMDTFATNTLEIAVPAGNPAGVTGLADLAVEDSLIGLCIPDVPCGAVAQVVLRAAGVEASVDSYEPDVRALLTRIAAGDLDAGIVYASDVVTSDGSVLGVAIPDDINVETTYPIAVIADANASEEASAFIAFVLSEDGRAILDKHGFGRP